MLKHYSLLCALAATAICMAQEPPPAKQLVLGKQIFYAMAPDIRQELKITEAQAKKIIDAFEGSLTIEGERTMVIMDPSLDMEDCEKQAMKALQEGQKKRLQEIWIQEIGALTMVDDDIAKVLKLEDTQKKAVQKILEDVAKSLMDLYMSGPEEGHAKKAKGLRDKGSAKALELLTEDQKKSFETLKGKEFKRKNRDGDGI